MDGAEHDTATSTDGNVTVWLHTPVGAPEIYIQLSQHFRNRVRAD